MIKVLLCTLALIAVVSCNKAIEQPKVDNPVIKQVIEQRHYASISVNTAIPITLTKAIDTDENTTGETFHGRLSDVVAAEGHIMFEQGAEAKGILNKVVESGHLKTPAELNFTLTAIKDKTGRWVEVGTYTIAEKKASHTNREVALIGGGAVVGGIIGKIINKDGSTEIGAAAGAVAGTVASAASGKRDIFHGVGTEITFYTSGSVKMEVK